jgi:hypothetical protein
MLGKGGKGHSRNSYNIVELEVGLKASLSGQTDPFRCRRFQQRRRHKRYPIRTLSVMISSIARILSSQLTNSPSRLVCGSLQEFGACIDGDLNSARFMAPAAMAYAHDQGRIFVAEYSSQTIRCIDLKGGKVQTLAGQSNQYGRSDGQEPNVLRP